MSVKTGKEIVDAFFESLGSRSDLNKDIINTYTKLYKNKKLTDKEIANHLDVLRKKQLNEN